MMSNHPKKLKLLYSDNDRYASVYYNSIVLESPVELEGFIK